MNSREHKIDFELLCALLVLLLVPLLVFVPPLPLFLRLILGALVLAVELYWLISSLRDSWLASKASGSFVRYYLKLVALVVSVITGFAFLFWIVSLFLTP